MIRPAISTYGALIRKRMFEHIVVTAVSLATFSLPCHARDRWPHFYPDDPIQTDIDTFPVPQPQEIDVSQYYDFVENTFLHPGGSENPGAQNINTLGEVPNSSWFVNRHGARQPTPEELAAGPKTGPGPDTETPWKVIRGKTEGVTPGFVVTDSREDVYFIKFDPKGYQEMATSAEAICTPFFHAFGYNVPENYVLDIDTNKIVVGERASIKDEYGNRRRMTNDDLKVILSKAPVKPDGTLRVIASKAITGEPLGHFRYYGTRPDDANDIIPHQHRRELRGLRVFAAWLNHDDTRSINSLDVYTESGYVKHYLIDFGSCLGSGSVKPQTLRAGNEYMWEAGPTFKTVATLGLWVRPYLKIGYPDYQSIGRFEAGSFRPELWRPEYPNPAFDLMDKEDAFWATKIVMSFSDRDVEAIVRAGMLSDPEAEEYLIRTLIERRDRIGEYYFSLINPLDNFKLEGNVLYFSNLAVRYGFADPPAGYTASWWAYDNEERQVVEPLEAPVILDDTRVLLPDTLHNASPGSIAFVDIIPSDDAPESWQTPVRVYIRSEENGIEIVGIDR